MIAAVELKVAKPVYVTDSLGRRVRKYGAAVGSHDVDLTVLAFGVAPAGTQTAHRPHHERIDWDWEAFTPRNSGIDVFDRVLVFDHWCEVSQMINSWVQPPVGFNTGGEVIHLKKVTG